MQNIPFEVFTTCRRRDLRTLRHSVEGLQTYFKPQSIIVATAHQNFRAFQKVLKGKVMLVDEDKLIPGMTLASVRELPIEGFPRSAGWYFQQLLKYAWCFHNQDRMHYLIWDADTIPLRSLVFFDEEGSVFMTRADEYHPPYFETFERLFGFPAKFEFSFISQHQMVTKSLLREMLNLIETRFPDSPSWAWAIMKSLPSNGINLFSEYETYGHWMKHFHPDCMKHRALPWLREGTELFGHLPRGHKRDKLAEKYAFIAFEYRTRPLKQFLNRLLAVYHELRGNIRK